MLTKLLKYDLKNIYKRLIVFYVLTLFFSITTRILFSLKETTILYILGQISVGCLFSMVANILINVLIINWVRFKDTLYKDEAYLTHTLPVEKNTLYDSKFYLSLIALFTSFIVIFLSLFIAYYTKDRFIMLKDYISNIIGLYNINYGFIIALIFLLFLEIYSALQSGFIGIIFGYKKNNNQRLYSVLFGFITYLLTQGLLLLVTFIISLFDNNIMKIFTSNVFNLGIIKKLLIISIVFYILIALILKYIGRKQLKKGVNVI